MCFALWGSFTRSAVAWKKQTLVKLVSIIVLAVSVVLLGVAVVGHERALPMGKAMDGERFAPELVASVQSMDAMRAEVVRRTSGEFQNFDDRAKMDALFALVTDRFAHGENRHSFWSNWILWAAGQVVDSAGFIRNPDTLLRIGSEALCGQQSYVLMHLAKGEGIPVRHVGLNGHVVMEAWFDDAWHMYDPDYEVTAQAPGARILSVADLERDAGAVMAAYGAEHGPDLIKLYTTAQDNSFATIPHGAYFNWKAQVLLFAEAAAEWLKIILPLLGGILGIVGLRWKRA